MMRLRACSSSKRRAPGGRYQAKRQEADAWRKIWKGNEAKNRMAQVCQQEQLDGAMSLRTSGVLCPRNCKSKRVRMSESNQNKVQMYQSRC